MSSTTTTTIQPIITEPYMDTSNQFNVTVWIVTYCVISLIFLSLFFACIWYVYQIKFKPTPTPKPVKPHKRLSNVLAVIISIGRYEHCSNTSQSEMHESDAQLINESVADLPVQIDIKNLTNLFNLLNYKIMPSEPKLYWTEQEIINFLKGPVIEELFTSNSELKYDGLIVCVTCHGMRGRKIITSDYRTIEKLAMHRIISITNSDTRNIPRIYVFDSCEGSDQRVKSIIPLLKPPTVNVDEFVNDEGQPELLAAPTMSPLEKPPFYAQKSLSFGKSYSSVITPKKTSTPKHISLEDISTGQPTWTSSTNNPDFQLAVIHSTTEGYQSKMNSEDGSYLIYEFTKKMQESLLNNQHKTLGDIFEEIQNELHELGKELPTMGFNNGTNYVELTTCHKQHVNTPLEEYMKEKPMEILSKKHENHSYLSVDCTGSDDTDVMD